MNLLPACQDMAGFFLVLKLEDRKSCQIVDKRGEVGRNINDIAALQKSFRFDNKLTFLLGLPQEQRGLGSRFYHPTFRTRITEDER